MKQSETQSSVSHVAHVKNGVVVLDTQVVLNDGQAVRVEPLGPGTGMQFDIERADRLRQLQQLFAEWTVEDGKLSDAEADLLHAALEQNLGISFRSPTLG